MSGLPPGGNRGEDIRFASFLPTADHIGLSISYRYATFLDQGR
jgi:hypothetical protein